MEYVSLVLFYSLQSTLGGLWFLPLHSLRFHLCATSFPSTFPRAPRTRPIGVQSQSPWRTTSPCRSPATCTSSKTSTRIRLPRSLFPAASSCVPGPPVSAHALTRLFARCPASPALGPHVAGVHDDTDPLGFALSNSGWSGDIGCKSPKLVTRQDSSCPTQLVLCRHQLAA